MTDLIVSGEFRFTNGNIGPPRYVLIDEEQYVLCGKFIRKTIGFYPRYVGLSLWKGDDPNFPNTLRLSLRKCLRPLRWNYTFGNRDKKRTNGIILYHMGCLLHEYVELNYGEVATDFWLQITPLDRNISIKNEKVTICQLITPRCGQ